MTGILSKAKRQSYLSYFQLAMLGRLMAGMLFVISWSVFASAQNVELKGRQSELPNVVIILADDLGYGDIHANNLHTGKIPTPNIDELASQGMRFTDAHSSSGVCSPSRYTLLTGRYHWRTRLQTGIVGLWEKPLIAPDRLTVASLAKQLDYRTACIGKWHLGRDWPITDSEKPYFANLTKNANDTTDKHREVWNAVFSRPIPGGPTTRGFDYYFGTDVPNWPPYCFIKDDRTIGIPSTLLGSEKFAKNQASLPGPALTDWNFEPILPKLAEEASAFIKKNAETGQRYLLYLPLTTPHTPLAVNKEWKGKSGLENDCADLIMETDADVGRVMEAIENSGKADNTLVIFTSDNGFASYVGAKELEARGHFPSGPLRGYKSEVYEGGHRVPFIVRWPALVKPASVNNQLVHHADVIATIADIFGIKLPDNTAEDSFSLMPLLRGSNKPIRESAVSCGSNGVPGYREGTWKLILARDPMTNTDVQLYDLANDLGETKNLSGIHPDRVATMRANFEKMIKTGRSNSGEPQKNDVKVRRYPKLQPDAPKKAREIKIKPVSLRIPVKNEINLSATQDDKIGDWNIGELKKKPEFRWLSQTGQIRSLIYSGEKYQGHETEVFAFYASPETLGIAKQGQKFPGIVLIHGGGGTAFAEWVWLWAKRGYAAIAMDLSGSQPIEVLYDAHGVPVPNQAAKPETRTRLKLGGPDQGHEQKFDTIGGEYSDEWPYHAVANVMRAHSLLVSFPEVIADRTAVTGISWGGYTTCLVASIDNRFKAAVPVYGCGFLFEGESVQKPAIDRLGERRDDWITKYDPSSYLGRCQVPILFVNGTNDVHYPMDSYQKSYDLVSGIKMMRMEVNMPHGHPPGWRPQEIGLFIDSYCRNGQGLAIPGEVDLEGNEVKMKFKSDRLIKSAVLHFTTDQGLRSKRKWQSIILDVKKEIVVGPKPPKNANTWFMSITDDRDAMISSPVFGTDKSSVK